MTTLSKKKRIAARKIIILNEVIRLVAIGHKPFTAKELFTDLPISADVARTPAYKKEYKIAKSVCANAYRNSSFFDRLYATAKSGEITTIQILQGGPGRNAASWDAFGGALHRLALKLSEANREKPGKDKTKQLEKWIEEEGLTRPNPPIVPTIPELKAMVAELQKVVDSNDEDSGLGGDSESLADLAASRRMSKSKVSLRVQAQIDRRRQSDYFEHRPGLKLSPLPPISRPSSRIA